MVNSDCKAGGWEILGNTMTFLCRSLSRVYLGLDALCKKHGNAAQDAVNDKLFRTERNVVAMYSCHGAKEGVSSLYLCRRINAGLGASSQAEFNARP